MVSSTGRRIKASLGDINGTRECDYKDCNYRCVWEPDPKKKYKINIDTYNEKFARPDINKCKNIIKTLYRYGYVYELDDIVNTINSQMKIETRFIYIAISEMINNINEPVYDMYDRIGYLIYRGSFYILQPLEFNYLKAPLYYRGIPFSEKTKHFNIDLTNNINFNVESRNKNLESSRDLMTSIIERAELIKDEIDSDYRNKMYIIITMLVDKLKDKEKISLLKKLIIHYYETNGKITNPYYTFLLSYFSPLLLYKYRDIEVGKGAGKDDKIVGFYFIYSYFGNNENSSNDKNMLKIFIYNKETQLVGESTGSDVDNVKLNIKIKLRKDYKNREEREDKNDIYGFMEQIKEKPYVFKIYDKTKETKAFTLEMKKSKRSERKGQVCSSYKVEELEELAKKIKIKTSGTQKKNICILIEYFLREYDNQKLNGKKWFINGIDIIKNRINLLKK